MQHWQKTDRNKNKGDVKFTFTSPVVVMRKDLIRFPEKLFGFLKNFIPKPSFSSIFLFDFPKNFTPKPSFSSIFLFGFSYKLLFRILYLFSKALIRFQKPCIYTKAIHFFLSNIFLNTKSHISPSKGKIIANIIPALRPSLSPVSLK